MRLVAGLALLAVASPAAAGKACYSMALPALASPLRIEAQWAPFVAALAERSGTCITPRVSADLSQFEARLALGEPDFAVTTPSILVKSAGAVHYDVLLASRSRRVRGLLVVRSDSPVREITELGALRRPGSATLEVAVASSTARYMSVDPQRAMRRAGIACRAVDFGNPTNVLRAVLLGRAPVGASIDLSLDRLDHAQREQLRIVYVTRPHLPPPLVAHPRVAHPVREAVVRAVLDMPADASGRALLDSVGFSDPVRIDRAAYIADLKGAPGLAEGCAARR